MNLELAIQIATLASVIIGFASLLFFVNSFRREMNARVVMEYSMRFAQLMDEFPDEFYEEWEIGQDLAYSGPCRSVILVHADHRFWTMAIADSG